MKYAKIIDKGECYSTLNMTVNGVVANKFEWAKYNFYPKNDMVGEVIVVNGISVLKITDDIYVPMSNKGIVAINYDEYINGQKYNVFTGMDERQQKINDGVDAWANLANMNANRHKHAPSEAEIYYSSYKFAVGRQGEKIQGVINMVADGLANTSIVSIPLNQAVSLLVSYVKEEMGHSGWDLKDVDGMSWYLGLYCTAYVRALGVMALVTEKEVFIKAFNKYFEELW